MSRLSGSGSVAVGSPCLQTGVASWHLGSPIFLHQIVRLQNSLVNAPYEKLFGGEPRVRVVVADRS